MYSCVGLVCSVSVCGEGDQAPNMPNEIATEMQINFLFKYFVLISRLTTKMAGNLTGLVLCSYPVVGVIGKDDSKLTALDWVWLKLLCIV